MGKMVEELRRKISGEEFDYQALLDGLREYNRPRDKITSLLRQGAVVRVKKGIYVFGERYKRRPFSREVLANMICGPSYISLDYALHYYGLIPERVEAVTSVTVSRGRRFSTPVGLFIYRGVPMNAYRIGIEQGVVDLVILLDDASCDQTSSIASGLPHTKVFVHERNKGYGGNQKTCYRMARSISGGVYAMAWVASGRR
jgi:hypothetical protein